MAVKNELETSGSQQAKEIFASVKKEIAASGQKVQQEIAARIAEERRAVQKEAQTLALNIIDKILDRRQQP
jgi:F-type H+-transporting ATPase subunit b